MSVLESRLHLRAKIEIPLKVTSASDLELALETENISANGVLVKASLSEHEQLVALVEKHGEKNSAQLSLHVTLTPKSKPICLPFRLVHSQRLAQNDFRIGLNFINLDEQVAARIHKFVLKVLRNGL